MLKRKIDLSIDDQKGMIMEVTLYTYSTKNKLETSVIPNTVLHTVTELTGIGNGATVGVHTTL